MDCAQRLFPHILAAVPAVVSQGVKAPKKSAILAFHGGLLFTSLTAGLLVQAAGPDWVRAIFVPLRLDSLAALSALFAGLLGAVLVHELGHFIAAALLDFEILGASLGPFRWRCLHGKHSFQVSAKKLFSGSIAAAPRDLELWRAKMLIVTLGGPLATLGAGLIAAKLFFLLPQFAWLHTFFALSAELNFFVLLLGFIPNGIEAKRRNDAALFWLLLRNGLAATDLRHYHQLTQLKLAGIRPCDYPQQLLAQLADWQGRPDTNLLIATATMEWALDSGDVETAARWDAEVLQRSALCGAEARNAALANSGCFDLLYREDRISARRKLAGVDNKSLFPPCFAHRVKAARLLAGDPPHRNSAEILRAQYALPRGVPYYDFERAVIGTLHSRTLSLAKTLSLAAKS